MIFHDHINEVKKSALHVLAKDTYYGNTWLH